MGDIMHHKLVVLFALALYGGTSSYAQGPLFTEDFQTYLSRWIGRNGGAHNGLVVEDPLRAGNQVLTFTSRNQAGDIYTIELFDLVPGERYRITFEYLDLPVAGSVPDNLGGFAGLCEDLPGRHLWYYGTSSSSGANPALIDNGKWRTYVYDFVPPVSFTHFGARAGSKVHMMFEDFSGSGGVVGDVYFDNIRIGLSPLLFVDRFESE